MCCTFIYFVSNAYRLDDKRQARQGQGPAWLPLLGASGRETNQIEPGGHTSDPASAASRTPRARRVTDLARPRPARSWLRLIKPGWVVQWPFLAAGSKMCRPRRCQRRPAGAPGDAGGGANPAVERARRAEALGVAGFARRPAAKPGSGYRVTGVGSSGGKRHNQPPAPGSKIRRPRRCWRRRRARRRWAGGGADQAERSGGSEAWRLCSPQCGDARAAGPACGHHDTTQPTARRRLGGRGHRVASGAGPSFTSGTARHTRGSPAPSSTSLAVSRAAATTPGSSSTPRPVGRAP